MTTEINAIRADLQQTGYWVAHTGSAASDGAQFVLEIARSLGELYVPPDCDPIAPIIRTEPTRTRKAAPFDRPQAIGWHGDFATHENRPELSLVYINCGDPRGGLLGAWKLASVSRVLEKLQSTDQGRSWFELLSNERLPFSYVEGMPPRWFTVIQPKSNGNLGLRFYFPSIERGCVSVFGSVPNNVLAALHGLRQAADDVAETVPTQTGSLLIANNWFALHDRIQQTVSRKRPNREALLCFVAQMRSEWTK